MLGNDAFGLHPCLIILFMNYKYQIYHVRVLFYD